MRLTCPNCNAQYEVDEKVVPSGGRDVQCSACGSTWFQYPADVALRMREADLDDDDDEDDEVEGGEAPAARPVPAERRIDRTVLDVLREEAERELGERRRARPGVETQGDLGLVARPRARSIDVPPESEEPGAESPAGVPEGPKPRSRRSLLPDIEELSSTLEPRDTGEEGDARDAEDEMPEEARRSRDFRRGLSAALLVGTVLVVIYVLAPEISALLPPLAGPLSGYVAMIESLRGTIAGFLGGG